MEGAIRQIVEWLDEKATESSVINITFRTKFALIGSAIALAAVTFFIHRFLFSAAPKLETVEVINGEIEDTVTAQGQLEPKEYVNVGAQVSGQLLKLHFQLGDTVKQGELLAEINPQIYSAQVAADQAKLNTLQAQHNEQQALIDQAGWIDRRNSRLLETHAVSREVYEQSLTNLKVAQAKLQSLDAQIQEAKSALEGDTAKLSFTRIYAPINGVVVEQIAREGETLNANQSTPTIVKIANLDLMTARAQVAEADISKLKEGMDVYFTVLGGKGRRWQGKVRQILPTPETINDVILFNVLMDVENRDRALMTDMSAQMFFVLGRADDVPLVPVSALTRRVAVKDTVEGLAYEVRVMREGESRTETIFVGLMNRSSAQVVRGLKTGDRIVSAAVAAKKTDLPRQRMPVL